jgi:hypothetical protein
MSQWDDYNEQPKSELKETLKVLANSNMSEAEIKLVLSQLINKTPQQPIYNSQFGDH